MRDLLSPPRRIGAPTQDLPASGAAALRSAATRTDDGDAYLVGLGQRVRSMRALRGMSRKVLAGVSGVSERYIAQLESGAGNVSIMLLRRMAEAIGTPLEDLVADAVGPSDDWPLIRGLLRKASPETIEGVKALLGGLSASQPAFEPRGGVDRIALIGLRGAGKSTLGRLAAERLGWRFVELNREIEKDAGFSIGEVFSLYGQDGYRRLEQAAIERVVQSPGPIILATGGGVVADAVTFDRLLASFYTIWIKANPVEHMSRVRNQGDLRPMGSDKAAMSELIGILQSREPFYRRAAATLDTSSQTQEDSLDELLRHIRQCCSIGCPWQSRVPE